MIDNELVKKMILKNNDLFKSLGVETVPFFSDDKDHKCNMSCVTSDELVYTHSCCNVEYNEPLFAFRNWGKMNSILSMYPDEMDMKIETEHDETLDQDCPYMIKFSSKSVKIKHYLQSYKFFKIQMETNGIMRKSKFTMASIRESNVNFYPDVLKTLSKAISILDDKQFRLKNEGNEVYALVGDEDKSVDTIKILVGESCGNDFEETNPISYEYFSVLYRSYLKMTGDIYVRVYPDKLCFSNKENDISVTSILRTKQK